MFIIIYYFSSLLSSPLDCVHIKLFISKFTRLNPGRGFAHIKSLEAISKDNFSYIKDWALIKRMLCFIICALRCFAYRAAAAAAAEMHIARWAWRAIKLCDKISYCFCCEYARYILYTSYGKIIIQKCKQRYVHIK